MGAVVGAIVGACVGVSVGACVGCGFVTVTVHTPFFLLKVLTVIFVLPAPTAVTTPFSSTVATFLFPLVQVIAKDAVLFGSFAASLAVCPTSSDRAFGFTVTFFGAFLTVTLIESVFPLWVFTVTVVLPTFLALTTPFALTVAIFLLFTINVKLVWLFLAITGTSVNVSFKPIVADFMPSETFFGAATTVTLQLASTFLPDMTLIVAVPFFFAVMTPALLTVATAFLELL